MADTELSKHSAEASVEPEVDQSIYTDSFGDGPSYDIAKHGLSRKAVLVCIAAGLGGFLYGFSGNVVTGALGQTGFTADFLSSGDSLQRRDRLFGG